MNNKITVKDLISPIIQDGKIIGTVTHVLVNDPTRGYGIFIESMLNHGN